jgi:alanine racemase
MVKADAYGTGMLPVVRALGATFRGEPVAAPQVTTPWAFGVATLDEAATLRQAGCTARIICTTPLALRELSDAKALDIRPALHRAEEIVSWSALGGSAYHLAIDTGMARAGIRWDEVDTLSLVIREHPPEGVFTHFHSAELPDGSREVQDARFALARNTLSASLPPNVIIHSDNSAAIARREVRQSFAHLVRPGIGLYGAVATDMMALEQTVHLRARVIDVRDVHEGESVSYDATWHATSTRRIATVALGYGDGLRQSLSNRGEAVLRGVKVPIVGRVTMDMTMLDVTTLRTGCAIGDVATFIGRDHGLCLSTDAVAQSGGMSPYELLVGLRLRVPRHYYEANVDGLDSGDPVQ